MSVPKEDKSFDPIPFDRLPVYDGCVLPGFSELMADVEKKVTAIREFKSKESDILICAYPKSGTHWTGEIVEELLLGKAKYSTKAKGGLFMEAQNIEQFEADKVPPPRSLNTHFPVRLLPRKHMELHAKIIHVIRNPKDVAVSYFHHSQKDPFLGVLETPWSEFLEKYTNTDDIPYGTWFKYEKDLEQVKKDNPDLNILTLHYEDMKLNIEAEIKRIADFLKVEHTDELIKEIAENVDFKNQSRFKFDGTKNISIDKKPFIYRKGEVGDWKNWFTVAQNEWFDDMYGMEMKDSNLKDKIRFT